jgi:predicted enzyme related to lactoylglutathione lyase
VITGLHAIIYTKQSERLREFFSDVLKFPSVNAGHGWLIFAAPPAELAMHPDETSHHELYLMCDDVHTAVAELKLSGVELATPIADQRWGMLTRLKLPSGDEIGLYQPKHLTAIGLSNSQTSTARRKSTSRKSTTKAKSAPKRAARKRSNSR